ncbi:hypothetical protein IJI72_00845 [Candidatus Saccharibacteria bacterium]|nr:hypothetical protein [Candidatus Saccharibacteria bacterium]
MKRRARLSRGGYGKISGLFLLGFMMLSGVGVVFGTHEAYAVIGGDGTQPSGGGGGGSIGAALVHYKYVKTSGTAVVGTSSSPMGANSTTISNDCRAVGGFWHVEWADLSTNKAGGSARPSATLGEMKAANNGFASYLPDATGATAKNMVNSDNYNDVVEPDRIVTPLNFKVIYDEIYNNSAINSALIPAGKTSPLPFGPASTQGVYTGDDTSTGLGQCWGSGANSCYGYISDYSGTYKSPKNEIFVDSVYSYFCGTTDGTTTTEEYVSPKPTTTVTPAGTDYTGSGTSTDPYVFSSAGNKTINFTFKVTRDDSVSASGSKFQYIGRARKGGAPSSSTNDFSETKSGQTIARGGSKYFTTTLTVAVAEDDSAQQICGKTWSYYNKWNGSSWGNPIAWGTKAGRTHQKCIYVKGPTHVPVSGSVNVAGSTSTTIALSGTTATSGSGSESDPYVVSSAGTYTFATTHKIRRTDSNSPTKAPLYWWAGTDTDSAPSSPSWTKQPNMQKSSSYTQVKTNSFTKSITATATKVCAATSVKGVSYTTTDGVVNVASETVRADSTKSTSNACIWVRSQTVQSVTFKGDVTFNKGSASGSEGNRTYSHDLGGLTDTVDVKATHKLYSESTFPTGTTVKPYCRISDWSATAPAASALSNNSSTCALANNFPYTTSSGVTDYKSRASTKTKSDISVPIGTTSSSPVTVCSAFRFEKTVTWTDGTISSTRPPAAANTGTAKACINLYNTAQTGSASFSGLSKAGLYTGTGTGGLNTSYLQKVNTFNFDSGPTTSSYSSIEAQLKYTQRSRTGHYLVKFNHYLKYTAKPSWLENNPSTQYKIQQRVGGSTSWTDVTSVYTNHSLSVAQDTWGSAITDTVDLDLPGSGKYARVCQRLAYYGTANYSSEKVSSKIGKRTGVSGETSSSEACVIIRNPAWNNTDGDTNTRTVTVTGNTPKWAGFTTESSVPGAVWSSTQSKYVMKSVSATARFKHAMTRTDSGFNEAAPGSVTDSSGAVNRIFASSPAISNWGVVTNYKGIARVGTSGSHDVKPQGGDNSTGLFATDSISAPTWSSGTSASTTWKSTNYDAAAAAGGTTENGWTTMTLSYGLTGTNAWRNINAGDEKEFAQKVYNQSKTWTLSYTDKYRVEAYCSNVYAAGTCDATAASGGEKYYVNTKRGGTTLAEDTSTNATSAELKGTIRRDYNFAINSFLPNSGDNETLAAGEDFSVTFTAGIKKDSGWNAYDTSASGYGWTSALNRRYITGTGEDEKLTVITYVVKSRSGTDDNYYTTLESATDGDLVGATYNNNASSPNSYCSFFKSKLGSYLADGTGEYGCQMDTTERHFDYDVTGVTGQNWVKAATGTDDGYHGTLTQDNLAVPNIKPGYKFCVAVGASRKSSTSTNAVISASYCTNVVKKPSAHVWGGSVSAGGAIKTSTTNVDPSGGNNKRPYGSWTDLGIIATGAVNKMSSGRASTNGTKVSGYGGLPCSKAYSPLTIANTGCSGSNPVGNAGFESNVNIYEKMKAKYVDASNARYVTNVDFAADLAQGIAKSGTGVTNGPIPAGGGAKVVYCSGNCVIKNNIENIGSYTSSGAIPQVVIIADGNIYVNEAVTRVDAWLIANGTVDTCTYTDGSTEKTYQTSGTTAAGNRRLSANYCTNRLIINGPVVGGTLNLTRTYGADNSASPSMVAEEGERSALSGTSLLFAGNEAQVGEPSVTYLKSMPTRY